jgi:putative DNA primase/helicase
MKRRDDAKSHRSGGRRAQSKGTADEILRNLDSLSPVEYGVRREALAKQLAVPMSFLDKEFEERRKEVAKSEASAPLFEPIEPWHKEVSGSELLHELSEMFDRYVTLPDGAARTCALWCLHTHCYDSFLISPYLLITSPTPECGKTTLAAVIGSVVAKPAQASNISSAAVFRVIEKYHPTLIIDEADTFLRDNHELRGILNAGHRRDAFVIRVDGDDHEPRQFSVWCPKVIAMIGRPPATLVSRSIGIELKRQTLQERKERFSASGAKLARKLARWAADNAHKLRLQRPILPDVLINRAGDNWFGLIAIADLAGGPWPEIARQLATTIAVKKHNDVASVELLHAIHDLFEKLKADCLASSELVKRLAKIEGSPWPEYRKGNSISANQVANLLKEHGIQSRQVRFGAATAKGYRREDFRDAFKRYPRS